MKDPLILPSTIITNVGENVQLEDIFEDVTRKDARAQIPYVSYLLKIAKALCKVDPGCNADDNYRERKITDILNFMRGISNCKVIFFMYIYHSVEYCRIPTALFPFYY